MTRTHKKQFGVWMDMHRATVVGRPTLDSPDFSVLGHSLSPVTEAKSNEKAEHNEERALLHKFFKEITTHMQNAEEIHITGTGIAQERFIHYLAETPQFKNTITKESTSNKMSDDKLIEFIAEKFGSGSN